MLALGSWRILGFSLAPLHLATVLPDELICSTIHPGCCIVLSRPLVFVGILPWGLLLHSLFCVIFSRGTPSLPKLLILPTGSEDTTSPSPSLTIFDVLLNMIVLSVSRRLDQRKEEEFPLGIKDVSGKSLMKGGVPVEAWVVVRDPGPSSVW